MVYNTFQETTSEYELLMRDYPGLITMAIGGARLARTLSTWDTTSLALIERLAKVEWRLIDTVFALFRDRIGIEGQLSLQQLRSGWRALWLASIRQYTNDNPERTLTFVESGEQLLDQMEIDFRNTPPQLSVDTWIDNGRLLILNLRETEIKK